MIGGLMAMVFGVVMLVAIPVAIYTAVRVVNRVLSSDRLPLVDPALETRLRRMEDAIDAMAVQIERLRTGEEPRYVTGERAESRPQPPQDDPPTFR